MHVGSNSFKQTFYFVQFNLDVNKDDLNLITTVSYYKIVQVTKINVYFTRCFFKKGITASKSLRTPTLKYDRFLPKHPSCRRDSFLNGKCIAIKTIK